MDVVKFCEKLAEVIVPVMNDAIETAAAPLRQRLDQIEVTLKSAGAAAAARLAPDGGDLAAVATQAAAAVRDAIGERAGGRSIDRLCVGCCEDGLTASVEGFDADGSSVVQVDVDLPASMQRQPGNFTSMPELAAAVSECLGL